MGPPATREIGDFTDALLEATDQLSQIADHMVRHQEAGLSAPDALPPAEVLRNLLTDTLTHTRPGLAKADVVKAAGVLRRTVRTVEREIFLVPTDELGLNGTAGADDR